MAIVINGSGTVTGLSVGGLPDGTVDAGTLATNSVDSAELVDGSIDSSHLASGVGGVAGISSSADATAMTIDSSERIGFPNAPHAWNTVNGSTAIRTLQLGQHTGLVGFDGKSTSLATNAYLSAGQPYNGTWKYVDSYNAQMIIADSGDYFFRAAPSGTAGNTISWNQTLKITSDGRGLSQFTAKAWGQFDFSNMSINDSHNFSSITDISTGRGRPNFTNAMGNSSYAIATTQAESYISGHSNLTTGNFSLYTYDTNGTKVDTDKVMAIVFGD
jgi:hypothetical protein